MSRTTWMLIVAAVLHGGALSAPETLKSNATAFVENQTRATGHRVACQPTAQPNRPARRIIAI